MKANDRIRLRDDPGRRGTLTGRKRPRRGIDSWQIRFDDGSSSYIAEDAIEIAPDTSEDPLDLLAAGRLGRPEDLRRTLTHVRLTGRLANIIYSMDTTGTDFYAYQFKPVLKLLHSTSSGILIADEVGLGKTIEAGLIWTELRSRFEFRRLLVICPAILREKWRAELIQRFGVEADIVNAGQAFDRLKEAADQGWSAQFALIISMQGSRPPRDWNDSDDPKHGGGAGRLARFLRDQQHEDPIIDLTIVDEAHYLRNPETMTSKIGRLLRAVSHYMVLLSATPIHLRNRDLFQLVNLIDSDAFDHPQAFSEMLEANAPLVRAREMILNRKASAESFLAELRVADNHPLLKGSRQLGALINSPPTNEDLQDRELTAQLAHRLESINLLGNIVTRTRKRDVTEWRVVRDVEAVEVDLEHPAERDFYDAVTEIVRSYCGQTSAHEGFLLVTPQRQMSSSIPAAFRFWKEREASLEEAAENLYEDLGVDDVTGEILHRDIGPLVQEIVRKVSSLATYEQLAKNDSKYRCLRELISDLFEKYPREKVIIFSYFRATLGYLRDRLQENGYATLMLRGGVGDKDAVIQEFRDRDGPLILLSTEVGSEGIDLQFAWVVVNYDLPWNPMKVEQRIGRVDRLGQKAQRIVVKNLVCNDTIDSRIYDRLYKRLGIFERSLGALEPVLGDRIRVLTLELLRRDLRPEEEEEVIEQTAQALENIRRHEEELEENAVQLVAYSDYVLNQVVAARELSRKIDGRDLRVYVSDFLKATYRGSDLRQELDDPDEFLIGLPSEAKLDLERFIRDQRLDGRTRLTRNDLPTVKCRFENTAVAPYTGKIEVISQFHPLVRFVSDRIRNSEQKSYPAVAIRVEAGILNREIDAGDYVFATQRWSLRGLQEIERLEFAATRLDRPADALVGDLSEKLVVTAANHGKDWLNVSEAVALDRVYEIANEECSAALDSGFEKLKTEIQDENEDRADVQERTLEKHYLNQKATLEGVAQRHRNLGRTALVRATEGRLRALTARVERRRAEIQGRRKVVPSTQEIAVGIIRVEASA